MQKGQYETSVPVIADRVLQARVVNALEPEWEARFEPKSYGFRPGRGCQDAISAIYLTLKGKNPQRVWVLDADLKAAFDRIDHDHLLTQLATFPARGLVAGWLKAGVLDRGRFVPTEEGTPQGGLATPPTQLATSVST
ncbi:reverse transcriptase/maturase family protein [Nocardia sp. CA-107356]|uniref:reverse transcriptase/maturase family protein n=1 Tax=Nocardia sp. CA-107356 TaxID=3239972 RepID=UPI003D93783E